MQKSEVVKVPKKKKPSNLVVSKIDPPVYINDSNDISATLPLSLPQNSVSTKSNIQSVLQELKCTTFEHMIPDAVFDELIQAKHLKFDTVKSSFSNLSDIQLKQALLKRRYQKHSTKRDNDIEV